MKELNYLLGFKNIKIYQDKDYFKFSLDSILLANFCKIKNKNNFYLNIEKDYPSRENLFSNIEETFKTYDNKTNLNMEEIKFIEILFDIYLLLKTNVNYKTIIDKLNYLIYIKTLNYEFL